MSYGSWTTRALVMACVLGASGCYSWVPVQTNELPLLNNMHITPVGSTTDSGGQTVTVTEVSVRSVHRPDGSTVRISGAPSVRVDTSSGPIVFTDPVISSLQPGQSITVAGANRSAVTIPLTEVEQISARQLSRGKTILLTIGLSILASGTVIGITFATL